MSQLESSFLSQTTDSRRGLVGNIGDPLTHLPMKRMKASDSVVDINITALGIWNTAAHEGMDYQPSATISAIPVDIDLTGSIVKDSAGNEYTCFSHTGVTLGLATTIGGTAVVVGAATASVRRLQGDFSGKETFNRFSTGTYIDSLTGLVKTAMPNEMRFERMADGGVGVLLEGTSTNIVFQSNLFISVASNQVCVPAPTNNNAISPDGTSTAWTYANTSSGVNQKNYAIAADTSTWTISRFFMKGGTGQINFTSQGLNLVDTLGQVIVDIASLAVTGSGAAGAISNNSFTVTEYETYFRVSSTHTNDGTATIIICRELLTGAYTGLASWGTQVENLPFATSYIPTTTAAVTRAADSLTIPWIGNMLHPKTSWTMAFHVDLQGDVEQLLNRNIIHGVGSGGTGQLRVDVSRAFTLDTMVRVGNISTHVGRVNYLGDTSIVLSSDTAGVLSYYKDGTLVSSFDRHTDPFDHTTFTGINLGVDLFGHLSDVRIYDKALTDSEIGAL
ncbi:MAG: hypothetical protein R8M45_04240 [Ghiorsea sp.]